MSKGRRAQEKAPPALETHFEGKVIEKSLSIVSSSEFHIESFNSEKKTSRETLVTKRHPDHSSYSVGRRVV